MITKDDSMRWFAADAMIFCNKFARWLQKMIAYVGLPLMLWSFATSLKDDYENMARDAFEFLWMLDIDNGTLLSFATIFKMITKDDSMLCDVIKGICVNQSSATRAHFWQTCLFTETVQPQFVVPNLGKFVKKACLSKTRMSCRRLV
jgi:hypothetical protein